MFLASFNLPNMSLSLIMIDLSQHIHRRDWLLLPVALRRSSGFKVPVEGTTSTTNGRETPDKLKLKLASNRHHRHR